MSHVSRCLALALLLLAASLGASAQSTTEGSSTGRRVDFPLTQFKDTLFTGIDGAYRARFDDAGHVWYSTEGGVVHVDPYNETRELFTRFDGLPSSYSLGLDVDGDKVYVGTDLGLGIIDRATGEVSEVTMVNSPLPDAIVQDAVVIGDELWMGTRFFGVAIWDTTRPADDAGAWRFQNTSTTTDYAKSVRRIVPTDTAVWVATAGDGAWRYDRATGEWEVTVRADGLPQRDNDVLSVAERDGAVWFGLPNGLAVRDAAGAWTLYNTTHGMPDARVLDIDIIPTVNGTRDVFASTRRGVWQLEPETGRNVTRAQGFGILGAYVFDDEFVSGRGWLFATSRGVSLLRNGQWQYFSTGPSDGPTWGPLAFGFTSASVGEQDGYLWFGSQRGLSAYRLPTQGVQGSWQNFGEWQEYPGSVVNWIDTEDGVTWFATNQGAYGFEHATGRWISKLAVNSRNLVYGVEADRGELWVALFGDGLIMENLTTGVTRTWDFNTPVNPLPDQYLTDVRADGDTIWLGSSVGLIRMDRDTGAIRGTYSKADGIPGGAVVYRLEPDGPNVWVGTKDGGVARFDVASGRVGAVWNASNTPGFPDGEVRSLHREGGRLWVGTTAGLARIDLADGRVRAWDQSTSDLVQNYINGITSADGILYLATLSGVHRMDIATLEFLPMRDGPGVIRASADSGASGPTRVSVTIDAPRDGSGVTGVAQVRGTAYAFGGEIDRVEVRIGSGAWQPAQGGASWSFDWDTSGLPPNAPVAIAVRAFSGELSGEREIVVTPVAAPTIPLRIEEIPPPDAFANRPLPVAARVEGDEPLSASVYYKPAGASSYQRLQLARQGGLFLASIPAKDMREGEMRYYLEAESRGLTATAGGDASEPTTITVAPAPRLAVAVEAPGLVEAKAGEETPLTLNVTNAGTEPATFRLSASGLRSAWISVPEEDLALQPGETRPVVATLRVPAAAFTDNTTLAFEARDANGLAEPATASVPIRILGAEGAVTPTGPGASSGGGIPLSPAVPLAALAVALLLRRRSS